MIVVLSEVELDELVEVVWVGGYMVFYGKYYINFGIVVVVFWLVIVIINDVCVELFVFNFCEELGIYVGYLVVVGSGGVVC